MKPKPCPWGCGAEVTLGVATKKAEHGCDILGLYLIMSVAAWNTRPIEDALETKVKAARVEGMEAARQTVFKHSPTPAGIEWMELAAHKIDKLIEATK